MLKKLVLAFALIVIITLSFYEPAYSAVAPPKTIINNKTVKFLHAPVIIKGIKTDKIYLPLKDFLKYQGFALESSEKDIDTYIKKNMVLSVDVSNHVISKNGFRFEESKNLLVKNGVLYLESVGFKQIFNLGMKFTLKTNTITINDIVLLSGAWKSNNIFIAHGLGGINNFRVTNSLDALRYNYENGTRIFEGDIIFSSDGKLVMRHDWQAYLCDLLQQNVAEEKRFGAWAYDEFKITRINDNYEPMGFDDIVRVMSANKDMYLVTDTKEFKDMAIVKTQFKEILRVTKEIDASVLNRIIPQIYNEKMLPVLKSVYSFKEIIYSTYQIWDSDDKIIKFVKKNKLNVVAILNYRIKQTSLNKYKKVGFNVLTYTVNDPVQQALFKKMGVKGIYTDYLLPIIP